MIQTILFDIDGVLLSEERCFDASALTVWELLHSPNYLGINSGIFTPVPDESMIRKIRAEVFCDDAVLSLLKSSGLNSNWDMVFITFYYQVVNMVSKLDGERRCDALKLLEEPVDQNQLQKLSPFFNDEPNYSSFIEVFESMNISKKDLFDSFTPLLKTRFGSALKISHLKSLWELGREKFQEWYVGDDFIEASIGRRASRQGKKGFLQEEIPLASANELNRVFEWIQDQGFDVGIGTGRPAIETMVPLKTLGLLQWIKEERITTSTDVLHAQGLHSGRVALGKPHPYTYLQSYFGKEMSTDKVLSVKLPLPRGKKILIVGDSVADFYAAQVMGAQFAAVLTGLTGEAARKEFETLGADYILNNVLEIVPLLEKVERK